MMFSYFLIFIFPTMATAYTATEFILLNCGASKASNDIIRRKWDSDALSEYAPPNAATLSSIFAAAHPPPSKFVVPFQSARVFHSPFTYSFRVLTGTKILRLYFYPTRYSNFDASQSFFSVTANGFTLLSNFSAFLYSPSPLAPTFRKEFIINIQENQTLNLTFFPNTNSFAFINGIEIVSLPDHLYYKGNDVPIKFVDQLFYLKKDTALENMYRLNVGGGDVPIRNDSGPTRGLFPAWSRDDKYIFGVDLGYVPFNTIIPINYTDETPPYSAPEILYQSSRVMGNTSFSLEWYFPVDPGFMYLLRFHFCEITLDVTKQNQRVFDIFVDNQTLEVQADVIAWTGGTHIPIFKDYTVWVLDDGRRGKKNLRLSLRPDKEAFPMYRSALLNGLEIFKLSDNNRSLAAANPEPPIISRPKTTSPPRTTAIKLKKNRGSSVIYPVIGSLIGVLAVVAAVSFLISQLRHKFKDSLSTSGANSSWVPLSIRTGASSHPLPSDLCRHFSLEEIKTATGNFDDKFVLGKGGFGNVYKGFIDDGATTVAIKRLNPTSNQGVREFLTEIEMLSKLRHLHLVSLIGYCNENGEMILVYDYMAHGTLRDHLYNSENPPLKWKERLQICIGAAKGLHYLHTGAKHAIIHRDIKSTNILLNEKWVAKLSDFGLSKVGPTGGHTHVSTMVKGSFGYVDPEYYRRQQLTDKSDVYSFGVVLFEVLSARPAIIPSFPRDQVNLGEWGKFCYKKETIEEIIDSNLKGQIAPECLHKFVEIAVLCLMEKGVERPAMSDVVWSLEFAMQLQEASEHRGGDAVDGVEEMFFGKSEGVMEKWNFADVFSEFMNPSGR